VPGYLTKSGEPIPVPLNGDAIAVLARCDAILEKKRGQWPTLVHRHVFVLRHACGYALANAGHDTRAIQHLLGHRNIVHAARYTELVPDRFKGFWRD
jgi:integrase